jgi:ribosomal protein S17E
MGKIKSKVVRRTADSLLQKEIKFNENFDDNKRILANNMPSKKLRNQLAGFLARLKKQERLTKPKIA